MAAIEATTWRGMEFATRPFPEVEDPARYIAWSAA